MSLLVKICGLKTPEALDAALDAGADMVGFVFFPPSPRNLGLEAARILGERVSGRARKVALSVDASDAELAAAIDALKPDMLWSAFDKQISEFTEIMKAGAIKFE